jgi:hypothetical protein
MLQYKYYKFPSKDLVPPRDEWPEGVSVSEVGQIVDQPGTYDEEGNQLTAPTFIEGWHVNIVHQNEPDLSFVEQFRIEVNTPIQIWLGQQV